jgi:predicted RNA polymerase sigma factor
LEAAILGYENVPLRTGWARSTVDVLYDLLEVEDELPFSVINRAIWIEKYSGRK